MNPPISDWNGQVVWLVGASTGIGRATAAELHALGATVIVSARGAKALQDFTAQHDGSEAMALDVTDADALKDAAQRIVGRHGRLDLVVYAAGTYRKMRANEFDLKSAIEHQDVNYVGALRLLDAVLPTLIKQGHGHLSLISSVAGYRGLPRSLAYGPRKAALSNLAETLYLGLDTQGVGVSVVNPGFVDTPLTAHNDFRMPALISPEEAAREIVAGWRAGRFEIHFPKRFTLWLKALRLLAYGPYFAAVRSRTGAA